MSSDTAQPAPGSQLDDASSLRAAALSTLKTKRKKSTHASSRIGSVQESIQLNYGAEDSPTDYTAVKAAPEKQSRRASLSKTISREEGEISDSEHTSPSSPRSRPSPLKTEPVSPREALFPHSEAIRHRTLSWSAETRYGLFDSQHVRPGLALTQSQYERSKDIVLDLLGWGVPPEYFLSCGLSREIIYYTFKELNLRLPSNIDTAGLPPYPLPEDIADRIRAGFNLTTPPRSTSQRQPSTNPPSRPPIPANDATSLTTSPTASSDTLSPSNLTNMELQRRQELLARKAVIASRKNIQSKENTAAQPDVVDSEMSIAPSPSVDDFLKTISPVILNTPQQLSKAERTGEPVVPALDAMDVDLPPGLSSVPSPQGRPREHRSSVSLAARVVSSESRPLSASTNNEGRRGLKRPVAADFVNVDAHLANGDTGYLPSNGRRRPKLNGFAGVSNMRRCIIDLSDSDSEAEEAALYGVTSMESPTKASVLDTRTRSQTPTNPVALAATPSVLSEPASLRTMSPAALLEKETEIRKMREMIAQRELLRQKKLGNASKPSTSGNTPVPSSADNRANAADTRSKSGNITPSSVPVAPTSTSETATSIDNEPGRSQAGPRTDVNSNPTQNVIGDESATIESAEGTSDRLESDFTCYISPLRGYNFSSLTPVDPSSSSGHAPFPSQGLIDLEAFKLSQIDPTKQLCHYEIPGGGICRDTGCEDVHLSRIDDVLDDERLALYLVDKLQGPKMDRGKLVEALQAQDRTKTSLEDRVGRALSQIGRADDVDKIIRHRVKTDGRFSGRES